MAKLASVKPPGKTPKATRTRAPERSQTPMAQTTANMPYPATAGSARVDEDYYGWLLEQAAAIRARRLVALDWEHLAEELEAMAGAERRELLRRLTTLFAHLLKMQFQPDARRARSRRLTVARSRREIDRLLSDSPGLKGKLVELAAEAYADAREDAGVEMGLERDRWERLFPVDCPWTVEQSRDSDFYPSVPAAKA
jgi:uncharacterized protein DUF29